MPSYDDIDTVISRLRIAEKVVLRQRQVLLALARRGHPTAIAEDLLETYEDILMDYRVHLAFLLKGEPSGSFDARSSSNRAMSVSWTRP
jgi:hypothetical protein